MQWSHTTSLTALSSSSSSSCSLLSFSRALAFSHSRSLACTTIVSLLVFPLVVPSPFHTYTRLIIRPVASRGWVLFIAWQLHASCVVALTRSTLYVDSRDRSNEVTVSDARNRASDKRIEMSRARQYTVVHSP